MATPTWDPGYLSGYLGLPQQAIETIIDAPTAQLVQQLLDAVALKAREHEELQADKLRLDVEFENAVRSVETKNQSLKATVEKSLKEVNDIREKLTAEGLWL
jgi:nucleoprotein TPR